MTDKELVDMITFLGGEDSISASRLNVSLLGMVMHRSAGVLGRYASLCNFGMSRRTELEHVRRAEMYYLCTVEYARRSALSVKETGWSLGHTLRRKKQEGNPV